MKRVRRLLRLDAVDGESGIAMAIVIIFGTAITLIAATALSFASSGLVRANNDDDWNAAVAAAYAGVEDYAAHLSNDNTYQQYGNPAATFSLADATVGRAASKVTLPTGTQLNKAFGTGKNGTWADVLDTTGAPTGAQYRYEVDNSTYADTGTLRIRSTGKVGNRVRSVTADLRQQGFINFLYFSNLEDGDSAFYTEGPTCEQYAYAGRASTCANLAFGGGDVVNGPVHSNDTIRVCDATFTGKVTTSYPFANGSKSYSPTQSSGTACTGATFSGNKVDPYTNTKQPEFESNIGIPATNGDMRRETRSDLPVDVPRPGCLYTGPTKITFLANGTMTVKSPLTKYTETALSSTGVMSGSNPDGSVAGTPNCGKPGTATGSLGSAAGATIPVVTKNLIFVQNVPGSGDVNYTPATGSNSVAANCSWTSGQTNLNGVGYPIANESTPAPSYTCPYGARNGDLFVQGAFHGQATISAENYTYVTGDITYVDKNADVLGLVSQNPIFIWNPIQVTGTYGCTQTYCAANALLNTAAYGYDTDREVDAAMISVAHSVSVQNTYGGGERGTLQIYGALAQNFRGIVHSSNGYGQTGGYIKNYVYDTRLRNNAPPKFLSPVTTSYNVTVLQEVPTAYNVDGSPR